MDSKVLGAAIAVMKNIPGSAAQRAEAAAAEAEDVLESIPEDYTTLSNDVGDLKTAFERSGEYVYCENWYDPDAREAGQISTANGNVDPAASAISMVSGFIPVVPGDTVYFTGVKADGTYLYGTGTISRLAWYGADKSFIGYTDSTNAYKITNSNARYIRFSFATTGSFGTAKIISLTKNYKPETTNEITRYFKPYLITHDRPNNFKIIDCWGDSRTEMVYDTHSAYSDYLQTKLGSSFCVTNHGKSSQASGMVSARMGSNEIFVTVENNRILSSGNTHITNIYVTSGIINNFFCYSSNAPMPCVLGGIKGGIYKTTYNNYSTCYFVPDVAPASNIPIPPMTKAVVTDFDSRNHAVIMWWGKNDSLTASDGRDNVKEVYRKAVEWLGHDRFLILGETCSLNSDYEEGNTLRTWLDDFNTYMALRYPDNFIDINAWLSSTDALTSVGLTATADDTANIAKGWPCESLMVHSTDSSDAVHPNAKGREAIANKIYSWMIEKKWIQ